MSSRIPDAVRREVLELLKQQPPKTYRQIEDHFRAKGALVTAKAITRIKEEAGLPVARRSTAALPAAHAVPDQEAGDGVSDLQPPPRRPAAPTAQPAAPAALPAGSGTAQEAAQRFIQQCGACSARWQLEPGEAALRSCPRCGADIVAAQVDAATVYGCGACRVEFTLEPGEPLPRECGKCGASFA